MNEDKKYKLNKLKKFGVAIGLTLSLTTIGSIGLLVNEMNKAANPKNIPSNNTTHDLPNNELTSQQDTNNISLSNEFNTYDKNRDTISISINDYNYLNLINNIENNDYNFKMSEYYGLDEALTLYNNTTLNKSNNSNLLDENNKLDSNKLIQKVLQNNKASKNDKENSINVFYEDLSTTDITKICTLISEVVNSEFNDIEINKVANTLTKLTMFKKSGSASNAYISNNLTFVYNPTMTGMYADMKEITGEHESNEETLKSVIVHEIMHLLEYSTNDLNNDNGIESGICRMYNVPNKEKKLVVDSLWNTWILEAAAELGMSEYLDIAPGTYEKKISYAKSYNLSRFNDLDTKKQALETVAFKDTLENAYNTLELTTKEEQKEFLKFMYSIEITQSDPDDFWKNYTQKTGYRPTEEEKTSIRMYIRTDAVKYLSKNFYTNLIDSIHERKITDLDTVFYFMRTWELDVYNHLKYTEANGLEHAKDFIIWQNSVHSQIFQSIADSNGLVATEIETMYDEYNLQANIDGKIYNNCTMTGFNDYTSNYVVSAKENYSTSKFSRTKDVFNYINNQTTNNQTK